MPANPGSAKKPLANPSHSEANRLITAPATTPPERAARTASRHARKRSSRPVR